MPADPTTSDPTTSDPSSTMTNMTPSNPSPPVTDTTAPVPTPSVINTGGTDSGTDSNSDSNSDSSSGPAPSTTTRQGLSTGAKAGVGVGAGLGALLIMGILFFLWRRRRQRPLHQNEKVVNLPRPDMAELEEGGKFELHGTSNSPPTDIAGSTKVAESLPVELAGDEIIMVYEGRPRVLPTKLEDEGHGDQHLSKETPGPEQSPATVSRVQSSQDRWSPIHSSYVVSEPRESLMSSAAWRVSENPEELSTGLPSPDPSAQRASLNEQLERLRERKRRILDLQELEREEAELERRLSAI